MVNIYSAAPNRPVPNSYYQKHFFSFVFAQKALPPSECCLGTPFPGTGHTHIQAISPQTLLRLKGVRSPPGGSWPRCTENPSESRIQTAIVMLRLGQLSAPQLWSGTMTGCQQLCRQLETGKWGKGELRQGRWWLLSPPRLADPITYRLAQYDRANSAFLFRREKKNQPDKKTSTQSVTNCFIPSYQLLELLEPLGCWHRGSVVCSHNLLFSFLDLQIMSEVGFFSLKIELGELFSVVWGLNVHLISH